MHLFKVLFDVLTNDQRDQVFRANICFEKLGGFKLYSILNRRVTGSSESNSSNHFITCFNSKVKHLKHFFYYFKINPLHLHPVKPVDILAVTHDQPKHGNKTSAAPGGSQSGEHKTRPEIIPDLRLTSSLSWAGSQYFKFSVLNSP